jgi:multidrug transporter EmrE-like cation transporter
MTSVVREHLFRLCAVGALVAAMFHAAAMLSPAFARIEYPPGYPIWRHVAFIGVNVTLAWLFLRRPIWLVWAFALLTLHILNGHGRGAWTMWVDQRRVLWISVFVDWRDRRR